MKFVSIWEIQESCHHIYPDSLPTKHGETLFVHPNHLVEFTESLPTFTIPFVLVTGCSDYTIPFHFLKQTTSILKHPIVLKWYAQNCVMKVGKLEQLPIGMDYHSRLTAFKRVEESAVFEGLPVITLNKAVEEEGWIEIEKDTFIPPTTKQEDYTPEQQESDIKLLTVAPKKPICYGNFHFFTSTTYGADREEALDKIPKDCIEYEEERLPRIKVFEKMAHYKFIISPFGNGIDCHRTWEALALGCIPIIRSSGLDSLFSGLPVMIVNDWSEVTKEKLESFEPDYTQLEKITLDYWTRRLNSFLDSTLSK
jgi:hypothetical protein